MERKNSTFHVIFVVFLVSGSVFADSSSFLGKNLMEARRSLQERVVEEKDSMVGARSRSALIFLERLAGNEEEAKRLWTNCNLKCRKNLPLDERAALETWRKQ